MSSVATEPGSRRVLRLLPVFSLSAPCRLRLLFVGSLTSGSVLSLRLVNFTPWAHLQLRALDSVLRSSAPGSGVMAQAEVEAVAQTLFDRLSSKVTPMINAGGANTEKSGSHMRPEALEAITQASESFFSINELLDAGGEMVVRSIEEVNGPVANLEAAMICAGAATGMSLMAAAALSRGDSERRAALPRSEGFPNELVVQRTHSIAYDQSWETTGGRLVFAGDESGCERSEFVDKIGPNTAALLYLAEKPGTLTLEDIVEIAAEHGGLPVLVDAASVLGGAEARWRLSKYLLPAPTWRATKAAQGSGGPSPPASCSARRSSSPNAARTASQTNPCFAPPRCAKRRSSASSRQWRASWLRMTRL